MTTKNAKSALVTWCLYDWGISAFPVIVVTFIFAAYFTSKIAINPIIGTDQWGKAIALAGLMIAIFSPIFGAIADRSGARKVWLGYFTSLVILSSALLWYAYPTPTTVYFTLAMIIIGIVSQEVGMVFYNAMLPTLVPSNYLGRASGWSWGIGYLGGLSSLIIVLFLFVKANPLGLDATSAEQIRICGPFIALWFALFAIPLFFFVPECPTKNRSLKTSIREGLSELKTTIKHLPQQKNIFLYLIAHMIYIDGLNTAFAFGGIYAAGTFHMDLSEIIVFGIGMNLAAGIGSIALGFMDDFIGSKKTILLSLLALIIFAIAIIMAKTKLEFWIFGILLCLFVGSVQAASRSLMARLVEKSNANEMFGLYAFSGKVTTFIGPLVLGTATFHFGSQRLGMATIIPFFIIGGLLLWLVREPKNNSNKTEAFSRILTRLNRDSSKKDDLTMQAPRPQSQL